MTRRMLRPAPGVKAAANAGCSDHRLWGGESPAPITVAPAKAGAASGISQRRPRKPTAAPAFTGATDGFGRGEEDIPTEGLGGTARVDRQRGGWGKKGRVRV